MGHRIRGAKSIRPAPWSYSTRPRRFQQYSGYFETTAGQSKLYFNEPSSSASDARAALGNKELCMVKRRKAYVEGLVCTARTWMAIAFSHNNLPWNIV